METKTQYYYCVGLFNSSQAVHFDPKTWRLIKLLSNDRKIGIKFLYQLKTYLFFIIYPKTFLKQSEYEIVAEVRLFFLKGLILFLVGSSNNNIDNSRLLSASGLWLRCHSWSCLINRCWRLDVNTN